MFGENGAVKSTLMKMIAGLVEPSEGSIELFGNFVPQTERYRIGCVIESPALYAELTAKQNLEVFRKAYGLSSKESVQQILKQVGLSQYENKIVKKLTKQLVFFMLCDRIKKQLNNERKKQFEEEKSKL